MRNAFKIILEYFRSFLQNRKGPKNTQKDRFDFIEVGRQRVIEETPEVVNFVPRETTPFRPLMVVNALPRHKSRVWRQRSVKMISKIIVHQSQSLGTVNGIAKYHVAPNHVSSRGCPGILYHFAIDLEAIAYQCNHLEDLTWHTKGQNSVGVGVLVLGDFSGRDYPGGDAPTDEQLKTLGRLLKYLLKKLDLNQDKVYCHSEFGKPFCPGWIVESHIGKFKKLELPA